jgi:hypothetical protein
MGIYNIAQIWQLQTQLDQQTAFYNKLVEIVQNHNEVLDLMYKAVSTATVCSVISIHGMA